MSGRKEVTLAGQGTQAVEPEGQGRAGRIVEAIDLGSAQLAGSLDWRQSGVEQDLVGVGVADARECGGVGEGPLQCSVLGGEKAGKGVAVDLEGLGSTAVVLFEHRCLTPV